VLGAGAGKAIVSAAKELGMAADEFAGTGLGKLVILLVIVKFVGKAALGIAFGSTVMAVGYTWAYRFMKPVADIQYAVVPVFWGLFTIKRVASRTYLKFPDNEYSIRVGFGLLLVAVSTIIAAISFFA